MWGKILSAMKVLISIVVGLLVVGCGKKQSTNTNESNNTPEKTAKKNVEKETPSKGDDNNSTTSKPADDTNATKLTPEERKVVGEYERKTDSGYTKRLVFLDNGVFEGYGNGKKREGGKWAISKGGEIHITNPDGDIIVSRINKDRSLTVIVLIDENGKREDFSREQQETYKKIK